MQRSSRDEGLTPSWSKTPENCTSGPALWVRNVSYPGTYHNRGELSGFPRGSDHFNAGSAGVTERRDLKSQTAELHYKALNLLFFPHFYKVKGFLFLSPCKNHFDFSP